MEIAGYIVMCAPKKQAESGYMQAMAYGNSDDLPERDLLLTHRGATLFATEGEAQEALSESLTTAELRGHSWPCKNSYSVIEVRKTPNVKLTGSAALSRDPVERRVGRI